MSGFYSVGKKEKRVDAADKTSGRAKYTEDLVSAGTLCAKLVHSEIAHGYVKRIDDSEALKIPGVLKVVTCFDVPKNYYSPSGHPWNLNAEMRDVADHLLLTDHVRYYGDDVAAVIATNDLAAEKGVRAVKVEYEELPFVLDQLEAMEDGAPQLHEKYKNNILAHTSQKGGDLEEAIKEPGLHCVDKWYKTPTVQHSHIENHVCFARMDRGRYVITTSTQVPYIVRRIVAVALGVPWGDVEVIKPYVGGGFGNKQEGLYEPICAFLCQVMGGRTVKLAASREETYWNNRVRHNIYFHLTTWFRDDGTFVGRKFESFSRQGGYASQGHIIALKGQGAFAQIYPGAPFESDAYTIYTNTTPAGAMRGYGMPQFSFAMESHVDDIARELKMDPVELRKINVMPEGYTDEFSGNCNRWPSHIQCMEKAKAYMDWDRKRAEYDKPQTGPIRRGIGMAVFWYNTAAYPIILEVSSCRMMLNPDGSMQMQLGETEIGQGADTAFSQMGADAVGLPFENVHIVTMQDTDITPFGLGVYASRGTFVAGKSIWATGQKLRKEILDYASSMVPHKPEEMDIVLGRIILTETGEEVLTVKDVAMQSYYNKDHTHQITAEVCYQIDANAYSFGCCCAEVEVDIPMCRYRILNIINVHDCGNLVNPALAEAQVHGGMSMGIGFGMGEELRYDEKTGRPVNGDFLNYKISTTMDHPHLEAQFVENFEPRSPFGTKALGEPPACPPAPAIRNALLQATGIAFDQIPVSPQRMYDTFEENGMFEQVKDYV